MLLNTAVISSINCIYAYFSSLASSLLQSENHYGNCDSKCGIQQPVFIPCLGLFQKRSKSQCISYQIVAFPEMVRSVHSIQIKRFNLKWKNYQLCMKTSIIANFNSRMNGKKYIWFIIVFQKKTLSRNTKLSQYFVFTALVIFQRKPIS